MLKQVVIERNGEKFVVEVCAQLNHRFCAVVDYVHDWLIGFPTKMQLTTELINCNGEIQQVRVTEREDESSLVWNGGTIRSFETIAFDAV